MLLGSCMPNFIEVARLKKLSKIRRTMVGRRKKDQPISAKILSPTKSEAFPISTRNKRHSIRYPLLYVYTQFQEADMNEMVWKLLGKLRSYSSSGYSVTPLCGLFNSLGYNTMGWALSCRTVKGMQTPSNLWPWDSLQYTNMISLPVSLTIHHAVWSWQGGCICMVLLYGVQMYTGVFRP